MSWLRDPLVQFFALGAVLLFGYATLGGLLTDDENTIDVNESAVALLAANFERQWRRAPTEDELRALIQAQLGKAKLIGIEATDARTHQFVRVTALMLKMVRPDKEPFGPNDLVNARHTYFSSTVTSRS